ncbi:MAG: DEAD/DEAH box helicase [Streptosporangiaceae bacterium]
MTTPRRSPSPAFRAMVFSRSDGICQRTNCTTPITLETFHVAHLRAHANNGPLHESNVEAWCARCNLTWGARDVRDRRMVPRQWQLDALDGIVETIMKSGAATVSAAPGAGKTVFAGLVFEALREIGVVDRMLAFVPRRALVGQWVGSLAANRHLELKPHSPIERSGQAGAVVTYQSLNNRDALEAHRAQVANKRTLLVLDEVHHVGERIGDLLPTWARNVAALAGDVRGELNVTGVLNLSGTLWRSAPGEQISTVRYMTVDDNRVQSRVDFEVTVEELVARGELRPIDLYRLDGQVKLADYQNLEHVEGDLSDLDEKPARAAMASLTTIGEWRSAFVSAVLDRLEVAYKALDGYHAKALIVAARQDAARELYQEVDRQMRDRGLRPLASLAISDEADAQDELEKFREQKRVGVLCTVDMAGEGYDCPEIAVVGWASNKLTSLYVRQVTARAMRVTGRERQLERVIPAAVVIPDTQTLVEQLVSYLAPFTHEVLVPERGAGDGNEPGIDDPGSGRSPLLPMARYVLEEARPDSDETVTVAYADGSQEDVDASVARILAKELERLNVKGIYAPRMIAASRRTVGELLAARPFEQQQADAAVLERLTTGSQAVAEAEADQSRTIEQKAAMLQDQLKKMAGWWQINGDSSAAIFNGTVNQAAGIPAGKRGSASVSKLLAARRHAKEHIAAYCGRTGRKMPRNLDAE